MEHFGNVLSYQDLKNEVLSKQDNLLMVLPRLVKKVIGKLCISRRGKIKINTLEIGGHVQMTKSDPEAQRKSSLLDCTWLESEHGYFNLEALKFLMHFREPRSSLYFYFYTYSHIVFLFLIFLFLSFFLLNFFYLLPFEL
jgi:hypothetical protein